MSFYRLSGLVVDSCIALPRAQISVDPDSAVKVDVTIRLGPIPEALAGAYQCGLLWEISDGQLLWRIPDLASILVTSGTALVASPAEGVAPCEIAPFLMGSALATIFYQRGAFPLHAAAVEWQGRGYAFAGQSGAGKSSLTAALCKMGCRLICDDLLVLQTGPEGGFHLIPAGGLLKLWSNSIAVLGLEDRVVGPVREGLDKHYVDLPSVTAGLVPLDTIYLVHAKRYLTDPGQIPLNRLDAAQAILNEAFRRRASLAFMQRDKAMASIPFAIAAKTPVYRLNTADGLDTIQASAARMIAHWSTQDG